MFVQGMVYNLPPRQVQVLQKNPSAWRVFHTRLFLLLLFLLLCLNRRSTGAPTWKASKKIEGEEGPDAFFDAAELLKMSYRDLQQLAKTNRVRRGEGQGGGGPLISLLSCVSHSHAIWASLNPCARMFPVEGHKIYWRFTF